MANKKVIDDTEDDGFSAARSAGTKRAQAAHFIRFTNAENARLHRVTDALKQAIQRFCHDAVEDALDRYDHEQREREAARPRPRYGGYGLKTPSAQPTVSPFTPLNAPTPQPPAPSIAAAQQPQIIISATSAAPSSNGTIEALAAYVTNGDNHRRDARLTQAVEILKSTAKDDNERATLATALDDKVKALDAASGRPKSPLDFIGDFFKI